MENLHVIKLIAQHFGTKFFLVQRDTKIARNVFIQRQTSNIYKKFIYLFIYYLYDVVMTYKRLCHFPVFCPPFFPLCLCNMKSIFCRRQSFGGQGSLDHRAYHLLKALRLKWSYIPSMCAWFLRSSFHEAKAPFLLRCTVKGYTKSPHVVFGIGIRIMFIGRFVQRNLSWCHGMQGEDSVKNG